MAMKTAHQGLSEEIAQAESKLAQARAGIEFRLNLALKMGMVRPLVINSEITLKSAFFSIRSSSIKDS